MEPEPFEIGEHLIEASGKLCLLDSMLTYLHKGLVSILVMGLHLVAVKTHSHCCFIILAPFLKKMTVIPPLKVPCCVSLSMFVVKGPSGSAVLSDDQDA